MLKDAKKMTARRFAASVAFNAFFLQSDAR
jgi:hypothetical protein